MRYIDRFNIVRSVPRKVDSRKLEVVQSTYYNQARLRSQKVNNMRLTDHRIEVLRDYGIEESRDHGIEESRDHGIEVLRDLLVLCLPVLRISAA